MKKGKAKRLKWSQQQQDIFDHVSTGASLLVQAFAGSGKTTSIVEATRHLPSKPNVLVLAFNVSIKEEMEARLPNSLHATVKTLNGLGYTNLWANSKTWPNLHMDFNKFDKLYDQYVQSNRSSFATPPKGSDTIKPVKGKLPNTYQFRLFVLDVYNRCKSFGVLPENYSPKAFDKITGTDDDVEKGERSSVDGFVPKMHNKLLGKLVRKLLRSSIEMARKHGAIDFGDQVYLSVLFSPNPGKKYDIIIVDEVQDLSNLNLAQIKRASKPDTQLIAFGDINQQIYTFRGASPEAMEKVEKMCKHVLPLAETFRCSQVVVRRQRNNKRDTCEDFRALPSAPLGTFTARLATRVLNVNEVNLSGEGKVVDQVLAWSLEDLPPSTAIISPINAPLIFIAARAVESGFPVSLSLAAGLYEVVKSKVRRNPKNKLEHAATELNTACKSRGIALKEVFEPSKDPGAITLTTGHQSKGLEWDTVVLLEYEKMSQQSNLNYVIETRSRKNLFRADLDDYDGMLQNNMFDKDLEKAVSPAYKESFSYTPYKHHRSLVLELAKVTRLTKKMYSKLSGGLEGKDVLESSVLSDSPIYTVFHLNEKLRILSEKRLIKLVNRDLR